MRCHTVTQFHHKTITPANIFEADDAVDRTVTIDLLVGETRISDNWVRDVMEISLRADVPSDVRASFACGRGALCYGEAYHPLLTIAAHDLLRIADFATVRACARHRIKKRTFAQRIAGLVSVDAIAASDVAAWTELRLARNDISHPTSGTIYGFAAAFRLLRTVRDLIDRIAWLDARG